MGNQAQACPGPEGQGGGQDPTGHPVRAAMLQPPRSPTHAGSGALRCGTPLQLLQLDLFFFFSVLMEL